MLRAPQRRAAAPRRVRGGTVVGFIIGLMVGMAIAVVVALMVTRSPVPFVDKVGRSDRLIEAPKPGEDLPDPNKPLYAKNRPVEPIESAPPAPREEPLSILERLFGRSQGGSETEQAGPAGSQDAVKGSPKAPDATASAGPRPPAEPRGADAGDRIGYLLQAGAFRSMEDADAMRAKLALLGFEAKVLGADVNGQTLFRVRVGPYAQLEEMNKARARLAESGIEASVVRQR
jgi:cell division protein FtsN